MRLVRISMEAPSAMQKLKGAVLEPPKLYFDQKTWIQTKLGNKISKNSLLYGSSKIRVLGKTIVEPGVIIRGDLATVDLGKNCIICENSVIRPPDQRFPKKLVFIPLKIGDHCIIERNSIIQAAKIEDYVQIGENCVIGKRCMISSCVKILDDTVLAPNTVCPPFTVFGGSPGCSNVEVCETYVVLVKLSDSRGKYFFSDFPVNPIPSSPKSRNEEKISVCRVAIGKVVGRLPPSFQKFCKEQTTTFYRNFVEGKASTSSSAK